MKYEIATPRTQEGIGLDSERSVRKRMTTIHSEYLTRILKVTTVAALLLATLPLAVSPAEAAGSPVAKSMTFYLHYTSNPPSVGGVVTNYIADTQNDFQTTKNSDFKAVGQPKITLDWYLAPSLSGPVDLDGVWKTTIFANSTALHPATWNLEFWEKTPAGGVVWDSGSLTPSVLGGPSHNNGYIDSPVYGYTLSSNLSHNFTAGNTLQVEVTVNVGATVALRIWYDSSFYPSQLVLPSFDYARVSGLVTQDVNGTARTTFFSFWSQNQRKVVVVASITDPFGGYDIGNVLVQIKGPGGFLAVSNASMVHYSGTSTSYVNVFTYSYGYNSTQPEGKYSVLASVIDNNGEIQYGKTGSYSPFIEYGTTEFSIGVQFPVTVRVLDSHDKPLASAIVQFTQGALTYVSGRTAADGTLNLTLFTGTFVVLVTWEGVVVARQTVDVANQTTVTITTKVYYPAFAFESSDGARIQGILAFVTYPNGTTGRLPFVTDGAGSFTMSQQPTGNYALLGLFEGVKVADAAINVTSDGPFTVSAAVYRLTVNVTDSSHHALSNATVFLQGTDTSNALVYRYGKTAASGVVSFELPVGGYRVTAEYYNVFWLTLAKNSTTVTVPLSSDATVPISMKNIPPPIWSTFGFQLVVAALTVTLVAAFLFLRTRRAQTR